MKKFLFIAAAALALVACNKQLESVSPAPGQTGELATLTLNIGLEKNATKATPVAYTAAQSYETVIKKVQILVFKTDGELVNYTTGSTESSQSIEVIPGTYNVCVLVNGPTLTTAQQASRTAYLAAAFGLDANDTDSTNGFVMNGEATNVSVVAKQTNTANVTVKRYASRVALQKVTNKCAPALGNLTVDAVWVANVVGNQTVAGEDDAATWYNKFSRKNESPLVKEHIIDGTTADVASLTYRTVGQSIATDASYTPSTPDLMYGYANKTTAVVTPFATSFSPTKTRLVVQATLNGTTYYYPYDLSQFATRNTASTVEMIISGSGLDDPQDDPGKLKKDALTVNITVAGWDSGESTEVSY